MSSLPIPALTLGLTDSARLLVLGVLCYFAAGWAYLALTGISGGIRRRETGHGPAAALTAALVWAVVVVLWPAPLVARTVRALRRPHTEAPAEATWRRPALPVTVPSAAYAPPPWPVPPYWYRQRYEAARTVLAENGPTAALEAASRLVADSALLLGDDHAWTLDAWDLLAHLAAVAGKSCESVSVYRPVAPASGRPSAASVPC
ncbi:hypothetical protein P3T27_007680 [Kitasatospora sp. MAA19]|uniref:hypothetical protein n=1 Tax=unclassified Kitasatospora TaxID=2633591 RepID=UPI002473565E|nr:hypothetical protein [Kitasatospora sp. MAA19]MDH6710929.1 hypothetical protein [Kitasatospora sp. MAA19]